MLLKGSSNFFLLITNKEANKKNRIQASRLNSPKNSIPPKELKGIKNIPNKTIKKAKSFNLTTTQIFYLF